MKKLVFIFGLIILYGCEDVVDVKVPTGTPRLVVDASLEFNKQVNGFLDVVKDEVRLSLSTPFFEENSVAVSDATVFLTNTTLNTVLNFEESPVEPGLYFPSVGTSSWNFGDDYELTVIYEDETYKASTKIIPTVPIDNVVQGDGTLFEGDETEIIICFKDDASRDDYYLFDFDFSLFLPSEDRFYQGECFPFSYFYEDMIAGQNVTIKILGIDEQYFNYSTILIEQSDPDSNGPFDTPPARIRGNVINTTNSDNYAFGYFNLSEANQVTIEIQESISSPPPVCECEQ